MFTKFKRDRVTLFLDPNVKQEPFIFEKKEKVDIILSPSLYWVKKLKLPLNSAREVKKLLPSIFEDSIPEARYSYAAYKSEDEYFVFAYEDKKIFDLLAQKEISYANVASVHFAQSEFVAFESAIRINEKQCMYIKDELLVLAPSEWIQDKETLDMRNLNLSNHTIKLEQFGHIVNKSTLYKIGVILVLLALIFIVEIFIASAKKAQIIESKEKIFAKHNLQPTMFQNRATLEKYTKINAQQQKIREYISYFLGMKLGATEKIALIEYKNALLQVTISDVSKESSKSITKSLDDKKAQYKLTMSGTNMKLEMKI